MGGKRFGWLLPCLATTTASGLAQDQAANHLDTRRDISLVAAHLVNLAGKLMADPDCDLGIISCAHGAQDSPTVAI